ncbi:MAG TPA: FAD-binding protein [Aggregatilineales bacterium]|nr:FAD-binding protein [Aggregatilineales bacterium]
MNTPPFHLESASTDVLVVGAGGAGLRAAIEIAEQGVGVLVVSKERLGAAHTCMAEGGYNVALTEVNPLDNPDIHLKDTLEGGAYLNRGSLAYALTHEAPARLYDLERFGAIFDRDEHGKIAQRFSGKQTQPHTVFVADYTGQAIMSALVDRARMLGVQVWDEHFVTALFAATKSGQRQACGALALDQHSGLLTAIQARAVILCTGGGGRMYSVTTNAASNTADGFALALRLGVELVDMEMIQFHPTGMVVPNAMRGKLVTESVRGEGGRLFNRDGERFMERYNPQRLELAGRDEVARAIYSEVQAGRGTDVGGVYLSVAHLPAATIEERLPSMLEQFLAVGVDIRKESMQIHPSMHHIMGGVRIDDQGRSTLSGLFAAGEVTGGEHGGNRLGGNALAGCQVMGKRAAASAAHFAAEQRDTLDIPVADLDRELKRIGRYLETSQRKQSVYVAHKQLQHIMWENVGIMRHADALTQASSEVQALAATVNQGVRAIQGDPDYNREWLECLELENMLITARAVIYAATLRTESRGAHYRRDYPEPSPEWERRNFVLNLDGEKLSHTVVNQSEM